MTMNLLHGDHIEPIIGLEGFVVAIVESHDIGFPCTILIKGWAYRPYSCHTTDVWGERGRAEW